MAHRVAQCDSIRFLETQSMSGPAEVAKTEPKTKQVAAIPFRFDNRGELAVLIVTSRETKRWVIPKGWPWPQLANYKAAQEEAWEEAGAIGRAIKGKIGSFAYHKRKGDRSIPIKVLVYLMEVTELARTWPETGQRKRAWFTPEKAADAVDEPELKELLRGLDTLVPR